MKKLNRKKIILILTLFVLTNVICMVMSNVITQRTAIDSLYENIDKTPVNEVGLLLGTSKYLKNGYVNLYYQYRVDAAVQLYQNGKIKYILISGDNSRKDYNEPQVFKEDLIKKGIPEEKIFLDYAGFRTLDSVVRSKEIFGQKKITIISQKFHNERAIYISKSHGLEAIGFNAKGVPFKYGFRVKLREILARTKMMLDIHLLKKRPKFLGKKISIS